MDNHEVWGYCRVSTIEQNLARQIEQMKEFGIPERNIRCDKSTGKNFNRKSTDSIHIYDLVMRAVTKLPDKEKEVLMSQMTINQLASLMTSKEQLEQYIQNLVDTLDWFTVLTRAITSVCKAMSESIDGVEDIISDYDKLDADKKKEATLKLMNNSAFQKDCCEILVGDMERIVEEDTTVKAFNDMFNITGWYKKLIKQGIGLNHEYKG